jgi:hypothetical protein
MVEEAIKLDNIKILLWVLGVLWSIVAILFSIIGWFTKNMLVSINSKIEYLITEKLNYDYRVKQLEIVVTGIEHVVDKNSERILALEYWQEALNKQHDKNHG